MLAEAPEGFCYEGCILLALIAFARRLRRRQFARLLELQTLFRASYLLIACILPVRSPLARPLHFVSEKIRLLWFLARFLVLPARRLRRLTSPVPSTPASPLQLAWMNVLPLKFRIF